MPGLELTDPHLSAGGGLEEMGEQDVKRGVQGLSMAAYSQSEREQYNARVKAQNKAGITQVISLAGTVAGGAVGGPIGASLGGMAGGLIGSSIT
jgi:hypothetical protein